LYLNAAKLIACFPIFIFTNEKDVFTSKNFRVSSI